MKRAMILAALLLSTAPAAALDAAYMAQMKKDGDDYLAKLNSSIKRQHACLDRAPGVGATMAAVRASCLPKVVGQPQITRSTTASGTLEVWRFHTVRSIYFRDGVAFEVVDHPPR